MMPPTIRISSFALLIWGMDIVIVIEGWWAPYTRSPCALICALPDMVIVMWADFAFMAASYVARMMSSLANAALA